MTTTKNNEHKKLNFSNEREQSQACLNSAEHEKNQGRKVLNVPNLRFPKFQGEWKESTIGEMFDLYSGNTPSRLNKEHFNGNVNWISSGELKEHYIYSSKEQISQEASKNLKLLPVGTFVIAIYGLEAEGVRGTGSIIQEPSTISQACMAFIPKGKVENEFLYSWYKKHGDVIGIRYAQGTKQQNLSYDILEKFKITYPNAQEQEKLNRFISLIDERIATQNKIIDKLQSLIKGISSRIFASIQGIEYRLGDIATITNGDSNVQDAVSEPKEGMYPFFDRSEDVKYLPTFLFDKEAIIYPGEGTEFMPRYIKGKFALHQRCYAIFDFNEIINAQFLYFYLKTKNSYFIRNAVGSTVPSLRLDTFQKLKVVIPSKNTQYSVSLCLSYIEQKCNLENEILQTLLKQKQFLLRQMFI